MTVVKDQKEMEKVPKLRFPEFGEEWEEKRFSDLYDFGSTNSLSRDKLTYEKGLIYNIHYGDIHTKYFSHFKLSNEKVPFIADSNFDLPNGNSLVEKGDIVIADASEDYEDIGKTIEIVSTSDASIVSGLHTILGKRKSNLLSFGFMGHMMKNSLMRLRIKRIAQGVKVLGLPKKYIIDLIINLPALHEQQKIADFLSSVDEWINSLKGQKEKLEAYKKCMMQKIFSQEIRFKDDDGNDFPEWEEKRLGEICDYKNGGAFEKCIAKNGKYNLITLNSIDINGKLKTFHKTVNEADWYLKKNDLIMVLSDVAHGNFLGLVDIISEDHKYVLNQRMGLLRKKSAQMNLNFLRRYINHNQRYFKLHGQGSSQQNLSKGDILKFKVNAPSLPEQQKIADFLSSLDKLIEAKQIQATQAQNWKKGLMQKLFV